jgi:predicted RNase H-like nuclease (RuvC/YqgF family)
MAADEGAGSKRSDPQPEAERSRSALQRLLAGPSVDLRALSQLVRLLPEIAGYLADIRDLTRQMDGEVRSMRQAVERLEIELGELTSEVDELKLTLRPLRRARARLPRRAA